MKYYKKELFTRYNSFITEDAIEAKNEFKKMDCEYIKEFDVVKERLPKTFLKIFTKECWFHDYHLKNFQIIHGKEGFSNPISVSLQLCNRENAWEIIYKGVTKVQIDYEDENYTEKNKRREFQYGFDDYLEGEFLQVDDVTISHEMLFASFATILIHFKRISIKRIKDK